MYLCICVRVISYCALVILHKYNLYDASKLALRTLCVRVYATPPTRTPVMPHCPPQQRQNCDCDSKPPYNLFRATITNLVNSLAATITIKANTTKTTTKANMLKKALATIKTITIKAIANVEDTDSCDVVS